IALIDPASALAREWRVAANPKCEGVCAPPPGPMNAAVDSRHPHQMWKLADGADRRSLTSPVPHGVHRLQTSCADNGRPLAHPPGRHAVNVHLLHSISRLHSSAHCRGSGNPDFAKHWVATFAGTSGITLRANIIAS